MLTILRRIRRSLIDSGGARKYLLYAIGEITLVVIGILIALQINNWNQNRLDHNKAELMLREINSEFLINKKELTNTLKVYKRVFEKLGIMIESFPIDVNAHEIDSLTSFFQGSSTVLDADLSEGSVSALINSSAFEIISNPELRTLLVQWRDLVADYQKAEAMVIKHTVEEYFPYMDEHMPHVSKEGIRDGRINLSFLGSTQFVNLLKRNRFYIGIMLNIAGGENGKLMHAIDRIVELSTPMDK